MALVTWLTACVPTSGRTNARLRPGLSVAAAAATQWRIEESYRRGGNWVNTTKTTAELDLQLARVSPSGVALAMQLKVPVALWYSAFDLFVAIQDLASDWHVGVGMELSMTPAAYMVVTHYLREDLYLSVTPRVMKLPTGTRYDLREFLITPQLALGWDADLDVSMFVSYAHATGPGYNFGPDRDDTDYVLKRFMLFGLAARY